MAKLPNTTPRTSGPKGGGKMPAGPKGGGARTPKR